MEEVDLRDFFKYILSQYLIIIICIIITVLLGIAYTFKVKVPLYKTYTTIVLTAEQSKNSNAITQNDLQLNQNLVSTYSQIIKSKRILSQVITNLNLKYSNDQLAGMISVESISDTEIIKISVTNIDATEAAKIANEIAYIFSEEVTKLYNIENINVVDKAEVPGAPFNMNGVKDVIIYIMFGLVIGLSITILRYYFDTAVKSVEQVEGKLSLPMLGIIPLKNTKKGKKIEELVVHENQKSIVSEGIKTLRTNLQFSAVDKKLNSILVTSSIPGEGKSFVSANLASAFAKSGLKVLLVDCDMRKGRQHYVFGVKNDKGLSNLLISDDEKEFNRFFKKTKVDNLFLLTMGTVPPNPSELLGSEKNKKIVDLFNQYFDIVIYDSVPVNGLPDSLVMSQLVDKVVIVTQLKYTPLELLENTKKSLEKVNADIAGVVVNKVPTNQKNHYTYNSYYG